MKITSKQGMTVELSDDEYGVMLAEYGEQGARYQILSDAGRAYKHKQQLKNYREQVLTPEQLAQVESVARSSAVQSVIDAYLIENGFSAYIKKRDLGGMLPESWSRTVERAREACQDEIECLTISDRDRDYAMSMLGFLTDDDRQRSEHISNWCTWKITVPDGWGGVAFDKAPLGF